MIRQIGIMTALLSVAVAVSISSPVGQTREMQGATNSIELTEAQRAELARRDALKGDLRQLMQLRFGRRDIWFRAHPNDVPKRP